MVEGMSAVGTLGLVFELPAKSLSLSVQFGQLMFREEKTEEFEVLLLNRRELLRLLEQRRHIATKIIINTYISNSSCMVSRLDP